MIPIVETAFGSHLYGTDTPASDRDWKGVHLPPARDILLQRIERTVSSKTKADQTAKNTAADTDRESWALHQFFRLVSEGQTVALDVLFSIPSAWTAQPHPIWHEIVANRHRLLSRRSAAFVGYCRNQANKYGIKGSRMAAARLAVEVLTPLLATYGTTAKLGDAAVELETAVAGVEHIELLDKQAQPEGPVIRHLSVCGRLSPYTSSIKLAHGIYGRLFEEYGKRARAAEANQGVDWKAMSHAVRVGRQALELLETGHMTFPRPEREHLIAVKTGRLPYAEVAEEVERLLGSVEAAECISPLPPTPDMVFMDDMTAEAYRRVVTEAPAHQP